MAPKELEARFGYHESKAVGSAVANLSTTTLDTVELPNDVQMYFYFIFSFTFQYQAYLCRWNVKFEEIEVGMKIGFGRYSKLAYILIAKPTSIVLVM